MNPLTGVLDEAWRMYKAYAKHLLAIAFVIYLVTAIIVAVLALAGGIASFAGADIHHSPFCKNLFITRTGGGAIVPWPEGET